MPSYMSNVNIDNQFPRIDSIYIMFFQLSLTKFRRKVEKRIPIIILLITVSLSLLFNPKTNRR